LCRRELRQPVRDLRFVVGHSRLLNFAFLPATLTVTPGTTVIWKNEDDSPHRIGDKNGTFTSAALDTDDTFSHTFAAPGE